MGEGCHDLFVCFGKDGDGMTGGFLEHGMAEVVPVDDETGSSWEGVEVGEEEEGHGGGILNEDAVHWWDFHVSGGGDGGKGGGCTVGYE